LNHIEDEGKLQKQSPTKEFVQSPRFCHGSGNQNEEITWAIVTMVIADYMPLSIVEGQRFKMIKI
jgi:hypothetical protein